MPYAKNHIAVKVPHRSGFDKTHRNSGTGTCGTLIPLLCDEVVPNSRVSLKLNLAAQMPPLASDTYMNVKLKAEAFFVPMRLLCKSFESWFCDSPFNAINDSAEAVDFVGRIPHIRLSGNIDPYYIGSGSLLDYLGCKMDGIVSGRSFDINPLPIAAYHLIYQEYYRNPRVQKPCYAPLISSTILTSLGHNQLAALPYMFFHSASGDEPDTTQIVIENEDSETAPISGALLADGHNFFALRQRNFGLDYYTGARVSAQQGDAAKVTISVSDGSGDMTIAALRAANSLQQFRERNNLPSPRLVDQVKARYNANLSDGVAQRPICIGSASYDMGTSGINQTAPNNTEGSNNVFSGVAAQYGRAYGAGSDFIISDFTANEPGYIIVLLTQVPEVSYSFGVLPMFRRYMAEGSIVEMANPLLQNVGDQPISDLELIGRQADVPNRIFGFQDRFADFMFLPNQIHGLFRSGENLESFVAQRSFPGASVVEMSSSFLQIPKDYLDSVLAVSEGVSGLTYWYDCMLDYKVSMPLAEFSIPSLQDPAYEHGDTVSLRRNGQIF